MRPSWRPIRLAVGTALLLVGAAFLVARAPGLALGVGVLAFLAGLAATVGTTVTSTALLWLYFVPLFAFGRSFSRIGLPPVQLPEVIVVAALAVSISSWWLPYQRLVPRWYRLATAVFAGLALVSVLRGALAGYPGASRGLVLVVYPLLSGPFAGWVAAHRRDSDRILVTAAAAAPFGLLLLSAVSSRSVVAAAYALYLSVLVGIAMTADRPQRRRFLAASAVVGAIALAATGRRGPLLAVAVAFVVGFIALTGYRPPHLAKLLATASFALVVVLALLTVGSVQPSDLPGVGPVIERTRRGFSDPGSAEEANVAFRFSVWRYALTTVTSANPVLGMGFGRPFSLRFRERDFAKDAYSGAHNSFVGVVYAAGFPAGLLFVGIFVAAATVCRRKPRSDRYRPVHLAWLAGAALITMTNVAAETTYIGGPLWLLVGWLLVPHGASEDGDDVPADHAETLGVLAGCER